MIFVTPSIFKDLCVKLKVCDIQSLLSHDVVSFPAYES